jgi:hypothetical protein
MKGTQTRPMAIRAGGRLPQCLIPLRRNLGIESPTDPGRCFARRQRGGHLKSDIAPYPCTMPRPTIALGTKNTNRQSCGPSAMRIEFADSIMHSFETPEPMSIKAFKHAE